MTTITKKQKLFDFIRDANEDELDSLYAIVRSKNNYSKSKFKSKTKKTKNIKTKTKKTKN